MIVGEELEDRKVNAKITAAEIADRVVRFLDHE
jgi:hypothetical protein